MLKPVKDFALRTKYEFFLNKLDAPLAREFGKLIEEIRREAYIQGLRQPQQTEDMGK